jgi:YcaO-like protein with predicted kinase domain
MAEETFRRIERVFAIVGITRLADVTWLDEIGIPVFQAVRPNSWTLAVSQGKGLTPALAKVSAAMESIESWHAERVGPGDRTAPVGEVERECGYRVHELPLARRNHLNSTVQLEWTRAQRLDDGRESYVPTSLVRLDGRVHGVWSPPLFDVSSNGLASGNTWLEAALHGLYEVVERDAIVAAERADSWTGLALDTVDGEVTELLDLFAAAGVDVSVDVLPTPTGLACFRARISSELLPVAFAGFGCHLDREVALSRALTEAAQSRATEIAGTRDDITSGAYRRAHQVMSGRDRRSTVDRAGPGRRVDYADVATVTHDDLADDLDTTVRRVMANTGRAPLAVDHTNPEVGVAVVHVVCPRLRYDRAIM